MSDAQRAPDTVDQPPSRRFTILFTLAMLIIAVGYAAVWRIKTERVVTQPLPAVAVITARAATTATPATSPTSPASATPPSASSAAAGSEQDAAAVRAQLTAALARIPGLPVISVAAVPTGTRSAARGAGADQVLVPALEVAGGGRLHLSVSRRDAKNDDLLYDYRVEGATVAEVVQRMAVQIAMSFGLPLPQPATSGDTVRERS